jgi:hypothetical protein
LYNFYVFININIVLMSGNEKNDPFNGFLDKLASSIKIAETSKKVVEEETIATPVEPDVEVAIQKKDLYNDFLQKLSVAVQDAKVTYNEEKKAEESTSEPSTVQDSFDKFLKSFSKILEKDKTNKINEIKKSTIEYIKSLKDTAKEEVPAYVEVKELVAEEKTAQEEVEAVNEPEVQLEIEEEKLVDLEIENEKEVTDVKLDELEKSVSKDYVEVLKKQEADSTEISVDISSKDSDLPESIKKLIKDEIAKFKVQLSKIALESGGGGSVAAQYANGGTMHGTLNVEGSYLSGGVDLLNIFATSITPTTTNADLELRALSGNWQSTYTTVSTFSAMWGQTSGGAGEVLIAEVVNDDTVEMHRGDVVYTYGARGNVMSVRLASNVGDATSSKTLGVINGTIPVNGKGYATVAGRMDSLDFPHPYADGDALWLGNTPGTFTRVKPFAPEHEVYLGVVERANAGNGIAYIKVQNGYELEELHNVVLTNVQPGDIIVKSSSNHTWENLPLSANPWQGTYTTVSTNSASWKSAYTTVYSNSSYWDSVYTTFKNVSSTFLTSETDSQTLSFNESTKGLSISNGNTVSLSALVDTTATDTGVRSITSNWENTFSTVQSNSSSWQTGYDYGTIYSSNSSSYITYTEVNSISSQLLQRRISTITLQA